MKDSLFRKLIWINVALYVAAILAVVFATYSPELSTAYENEPLPWLMSIPWLGGGILFAMATALIASLVGLYFYKSWARPLALHSTIIGLVLTPFFGASVSSGVESALFEAGAMTWGAIVALSYFSSVSSRFSANNSFKPTPLRGAA